MARLVHRLLAAPGATALEVAVKLYSQRRVVWGPFKGMRFRSAPLCMLLGTYEMELHPVFRELKSCQFDQIASIGAAEGYYAVGMAQLWPRARVVAFEAQEYLRRAISKNAASNSVADRIAVSGVCEVGDVKRLTEQAPGQLVMMDVEGGEMDLLDLTEAPGLRDCPIIVELHDLFGEACSSTIRERFSASHTIREYPTTVRTLACFPIRAFHWGVMQRLAWCKNAIEASMKERLGPQTWFLMIPRTRDGVHEEQQARSASA